MPDVVTQTLNGNGNQFNIDQVNNISDKDQLWDPDVSSLAPATSSRMPGPRVATPSSTIPRSISKLTVPRSATVSQPQPMRIASQEAFTQNIVMGANIQFNSIDMSVAGNDLTDDHSI